MPRRRTKISGRPGPRAHSQHEHGKRDRDKRRRDAILRHRQPKPNQFVENAAEPREEKEREIPAHPCSLDNEDLDTRDGVSMSLWGYEGD